MSAPAKPALSPARLAAIIRRINKHKEAIGRHRDALREIIEDVQEVCSCADDAEESLTYAVERLSEQL